MVLIVFVAFDVCGFGCVKKVNPLCTKFEISSCFACNEKISFVEEIFHKFPHTHSYYLPTCFMSSYGVVFFVSRLVCD